MDQTISQGEQKEKTQWGQPFWAAAAFLGGVSSGV
jgi:hypothetical protein